MVHGKVYIISLFACAHVKHYLNEQLLAVVALARLSKPATRLQHVLSRCEWVLMKYCRERGHYERGHKKTGRGHNVTSWGHNETGTQ